MLLPFALRVGSIRSVELRLVEILVRGAEVFNTANFGRLWGAIDSVPLVGCSLLSPLPRQQRAILARHDRFSAGWRFRLSARL
ncbi:hypothetical protein RHRU231_690005 [Rhodococcus ruber]|uniref:Uncharacterized protein n=1 Tax=Rhodococcus ruber TaxID=1830 RepID=A0A098BP05_9NOCA|nr:hypothetical protein RHRU231_690005 [Rhodococcus ruber]